MQLLGAFLEFLSMFTTGIALPLIGCVALVEFIRWLRRH